MVELPRVPRRLATIEAPNEASPEAFGASSSIIGRALTGLAGDLGNAADVATRLWQETRQATKSVNEAKKLGELQRSDAELRLRFQGDPEGYKTAATAMVDRMAESEEDADLVPTLRIAGEKTMSDGFVRLTAQGAERVARQNTDALNLELDQLRKQMATYELSGDIGSGIYDDMVTRFDVLVDEAIRNPTIGMTPADGERLKQARVTEMRVNDATYSVRQIYGETRDFYKAKQAADAILTDPDISLTADERLALNGAMINSLRKDEAEARARVDEFTRQSGDIVKSIKDGSFDPAQVEAFLRRASDQGAIEAVSNVITARGERLAMDQIIARRGAPPDPGLDLLRGALAPGKPASAIDGLNQTFRSRLSSMIQAMPPELRNGVRINSGFRDARHQATILERTLRRRIGAEEAARWRQEVERFGGDVVAAGEANRARYRELGITKWVAMPGSSKHQKGLAVDLGYVAPGARDWFHKNAERFGLSFPMGHEDWHIELAGARSPVQQDMAPDAADGPDNGIPVGYFDQVIGVESGGDPNARASTSSATGLGQFIDSTWLAVVRRHRPDIAEGRSDSDILAMRTDPRLSREMLERFTEDNADGLEAADIPINGGTLYLAHFLGLGDAIKVMQADPTAPVSDVVNARSIAANPAVFDGVRTVADLRQWGQFKGTPSDDLARSASYRADAGVAVEAIRPQIEPLLDDMTAQVKRFEIPKPSELSTLFDLVSVAGTPEQKRRAAEIDVMARQSGAVAEMGAADRDRLIADAEGRMAGNASAFESQMIERLRDQDSALDKGFADRPYSTATRIGLTQPLPPIGGNDTQVQAALAARVRAQSVIRAREGMPAFSIFEGEERKRFAEELAARPPEQVAAVLQQVAGGLPADIAVATFADIASRKDAVGDLTIAAQVAGEGRTALASEIVRGMRLMADKKAKAGPDMGAARAALPAFLPAFAPAVVDAAEGGVSPLDHVMKGAAALYAARGGTNGKDEFDEALWQGAVSDVVGGIVYKNGSGAAFVQSEGRAAARRNTGGDDTPVIAPRPGMSQGEFDRVMMSITPDALRDADDGVGNPVTPDDVRGPGIRLEFIGGGRYLLRMSTGYVVRSNRTFGAGPAGARPVSPLFVLDLSDGG